MVHKLQLKNISVLHVRGNPLRRLELGARIDIRKFKAAIILVDQSWVDPDMDATNGLQLKNQSDMLRLDSLSMAVQLNIRKLLQVIPHRTFAPAKKIKINKSPCVST
jgi:hypothetical protein